MTSKENPSGLAAAPGHGIDNFKYTKKRYIGQVFSGGGGR